MTWDQDQDNLDPQTARGNRNWWILTDLYDTHTYLPGYALEAKPLLAASWTVTGGGTIYTFKLRRGIKFTTGNELTAEAVKHSIDRMEAVKLGALFLTVAFERADVVDRYAVRFRLKFPYAAWPVILAQPTVYGVVDPPRWAFACTYRSISARVMDRLEERAGDFDWFPTERHALRNRGLYFDALEWASIADAGKRERLLDIPRRTVPISGEDALITLVVARDGSALVTSDKRSARRVSAAAAAAVWNFDTFLVYVVKLKSRLP